MSKIKVNSLEGVGASTPAISIDNASGTCTANLSNRQGKNLVVNGSCLIAQRGTSSTSSSYQTVDRFEMHYSGTDEAPTQAQVDVASGTTPYNLGFRKAFSITNGNQTSGAGAADYIWIQYHIEAQDIANSGWNYLSSSSNITLSFYIKSSVAQDFKGYLRSRDSTNYMYPFATGSLSADTWTKVTKTISGNSNLVFNNDNGEGLQINILAFMGTNTTSNSVTENAWAEYVSAGRIKDNTSTWYTTNDATLEITGVQLEVSDHATDFEHRSFAQELTLCQRYCYVAYIKESGHSGKMALPSNVAMWNTTSPYMNMSFPNQMRTTPSLSMFNVSSAIQIPFSSPSTVNVSTLYLSYAHRQGTLLYGSGSGGAGVAGQTSNGYIQSDNLSVGQGIFFSAEL